MGPAKGSYFPVGKINPELLQALFNTYQIRDPSVIVGPKVGEDAAILDIGDKYLVAKTDPITFATDQIGWYLVCICGNDIATMGATPKWLLVTVLLPEQKTDENMVNEIFLQITTACDKFNVTLCGGHTEVTYGLDRPIVVGQMLGLLDKGKLVTSSGAVVGDDVLLTKGIAIEAVSIIAREKEDELRQFGYSDEFINRSKKFLFEPGISVLKEAMIASEVGGVHAMHDPTEGGLSTGLYELAKCSNVGISIDLTKINVLPECLDLCSRYGIDPLGVISSGSLIIIADPAFSQRIAKAIMNNGIDCRIIGKVIDSDPIVTFDDGTQMPIFEADEITKLFSSGRS